MGKKKNLLLVAHSIASDVVDTLRVASSLGASVGEMEEEEERGDRPGHSRGQSNGSPGRPLANPLFRQPRLCSGMPKEPYPDKLRKLS